VHLGRHSTVLFCDAAIRFLEGLSSNEPFFAYVSFMAPHDPRSMPREFLDLYDPDDIELPPNFMGAHPFDNGELKIRDEQLEDWPRTPEAIRKHIAEYYAMISHLDAGIRRVLDALEKSGKAGDTIIVFAGDNGLAVGQHGLMGKQSQYDHSLRVPLLLAGPGLPAGESRDQLVYLHDLFPTLCELAGEEIPPSVESKSLAPLLHDQMKTGRKELRFAYKDCQRAVRDDRYKLIEYAVEGRRTTQLFDLAEDPWELQNLAGDPRHRERLAHLRERLRCWQTEYGDTRELGRRFWGAGRVIQC
jgi:arylsulfatase A-like enzyme